MEQHDGAPLPPNVNMLNSYIGAPADILCMRKPPHAQTIACLKVPGANAANQLHRNDLLLCPPVHRLMLPASSVCVNVSLS